MAACAGRMQLQLGLLTGSSSPGRRPRQPIHSHKPRCCEPGHSRANLSAGMGLQHANTHCSSPESKIGYVCRADAAARRAADKAAAAHAKGPASQLVGTCADAASPGTGSAGQLSARERVQRHAQTPSKIPAPTHAGSARMEREAPRISAPTPTNIPVRP